MPMSVKAVGKPSMIATTISASISSPMWPLVRLPHGMKTAMASRISAISEKPNHSSVRIFMGGPGLLAVLARDDHLVELLDVLVLDVDHLLQLVDVDLLHVVLARGPVALPDADHAADDLDDALRQQDRPRQRNHGLEGIDRRSLVGDVRVLVDAPGVGRVVVARVGQGDD